ncbi:hypothetical protein ACHAXA_000981 [Cyclostephanos tholiformis]|uniref:Uncharacterized protein n=1 Tax=Cyclostephanos tholiformis TaxID=382380 RepID=A0ABD3SE86_9STRA
MSYASTLTRLPARSSSLLRRSHSRRPPTAIFVTPFPSSFHSAVEIYGIRGPATSTSSYSPLRSTHRRHCCRGANDVPRSYSSAARDSIDDDDDDDDDVPRRRRVSSSNLLPTRHSRSLPPPACPPSLLRFELKSILDAPIGSLIPYDDPTSGTSGLVLRTVEEEILAAYYASDVAVQRAEYVMRGLNARASVISYVSRSLERGTMTYEGNGDDDDGCPVRGGGTPSSSSSTTTMGKEECLRAMLDLLERMIREGETYAELRRRVRSQVLDPSADGRTSSSGGEGAGGGTGDDDSSSSSSDSDDDEMGDENERDANASFEKWAESVNKNMARVGITNGAASGSGGAGGGMGHPTDVDAASSSQSSDPERYQYGADPGVTTHMYDLVLDALACLCHEHRHGGGGGDAPSSLIDLVNIMPENSRSPPELAKSMLDEVLRRHWIDGGDIGVGGGRGGEGRLGSPMSGIGRGIGAGAGTGAGSLAGFDLRSSRNFDVRTCPTPMTFNAVLRVASNFDPTSYAEAVENAKVLGGAIGNSTKTSMDIAADLSRRERERLRDVTIDAALSTYSRMHECSALTLRILGNSTRMATSRSALRRQARLLDGNVKGKRANDVIGGRNSATYAYLIRTIGNCIPPSLTRGNMAFALYHKGCVEEGVMDEEVVKAMMSLGGYVPDMDDVEVDEGGDASPPLPPISNGPIFDSFMQKELGLGVKVAIDKGRKLRQDRNYRMRRHVEWDGTY